MTNLGKSLGSAIGAGLGYLAGHTLGGAAAGGASGAYLGARLDHDASGAFRSMVRYGKTPNALNAIERSASPIVKQYQGIDQQKLVGTKYEQQIGQALAQDPQKAAVIHYMLSQNDPEYLALMSGERK